MKYLDRTFRTPQENLACDEALLDWCEEGFADEILRFWEPRQHFVVLGYSNKSRTEVNLDSCRDLGIPVLRRCSGGGTVLQGPGCLNYSLVLRISDSGPLAHITDTNNFIMQKHRNALSSLIPHPSSLLVSGHTDLALGGFKFSGNAQRRKRHCLLFHGSFLLDVDIALIERVLPLPSRQPTYRGNRPHHEFLTNLDLTAHQVKEALKDLWHASEPLTDIPMDKVALLVKTRYSTDDWNFKF